MKGTNLINRRRRLATVFAGALAGGLVLGGGGARAQTAPAGLSPALQRVVDFTKGGMGDELILTTCVTNAGAVYTLSTDDIVYLHKQGVSDAVIKALILTAAPAANLPPAPVTNPNPLPTPPVSAAPVPPPLDAATPVVATPITVPAPLPPPPVQAGLQDNFATDAGLNDSLWLTQSGVLAALGGLSGSQVPAELGFSPAGMRMSGIRAAGQFMGLQSRAGFRAPFIFSATVSGLRQSAIPFEIYLVSTDLQQWVSVAGNLGGKSSPRSGNHAYRENSLLTVGGSAANYGVWVNHTGNSLPISARGYKIFDQPMAGTTYTVRIEAGADGAAMVSLQDATGVTLAAQDVPVGLGPFYVVLAGRDGFTEANWRSVQVIPAAPPAAAITPAVPAAPTLDYFQAQLAPYGTWVTVPQYGLCWQPAVTPGWRPYYDGGSWADTDSGWYWRSDYPWGDIPFHYGRWAYTATGWVWVPGYDYAPAWVVWRHADAAGYLGWAPLPPGAVLVDGAWLFHGGRVGAEGDFGLSLNFFTFVALDHLGDRDYRRVLVPRDQVAAIYRASTVENGYRQEDGRLVNPGLARDRVAAFTHQPLRPAASAQDLKRQEEQRNGAVRREDVRNFKADSKPNALKVVPGGR